jgi:hypothetical protein
MVGAAVKPFLTRYGFFLRQVEAAMGARDHLGRRRALWFFRRLRRLRGPTALDGPNDDQHQQQNQQVFHPMRPSITSMTNREPA